MSYALLLDFSQGNSGGEEGGLDARKGSSEKMAVSLGIGVDEIPVDLVNCSGDSAILGGWIVCFVDDVRMRKR